MQVAYLEMLKGKGLELFAAYGNTTTDIRAYAAAGIPKVPGLLLSVCTIPCCIASATAAIQHRHHVRLRLRDNQTQLSFYVPFCRSGRTSSARMAARGTRSRLTTSQVRAGPAAL